MFKAVLFDFDGVLVNSMPFHVTAWQNLFRAFNISVQPDDVLLTEGCRSIELAEKIFSDWNYDISSEELDKFVEQKQLRYQEITQAELDPSAVPLIDKLKRRGKLIGLVTGTARSNVDKILAPENRTIFDVLVTGDDLKKGKPNPEGYLKAAGKLNLAPGQCLVVENAPLGIQAARNAGMKVVALTTTLKRRQLAGADFYSSSLAELEKSWDKICR